MTAQKGLENFIPRFSGRKKKKATCQYLNELAVSKVAYSTFEYTHMLLRYSFKNIIYTHTYLIEINLKAQITLEIASIYP